jgi:hypothetical protein
LFFKTFMNSQPIWHATANPVNPPTHSGAFRPPPVLKR